MSYTALYRKFRPKDFSCVVGQEHIVKILSNQIKKNKVSHAYLFCGTRGTGKTSIAKIFAKAINCYDKKDGQPCNKCDSCIAINSNKSVNVIEIDAASNNGVDNIREINEEVKYVPTQGIYKVYIIDEVHMLSIGAFNALLKTLEEPPDHIIFILATTDPQKIPPTINSRCQRFEFKRINIEVMMRALKNYMYEENIKIEEDALRYISKLSDGAMRDALSILDQCISFYYNEIITLEKVINISGSTDKMVFFNLTDAIISYDTSSCIKIIDNLMVNGRDINQFLIDFITHLRNLLIISNVGKSMNILDISLENIEMLEKQAKSVDCNVLMNYINKFSDLQGRLRFNSNHRILFEIECIRLCNPNIVLENENLENLNERIIKLEKFINGSVLNSEDKSIVNDDEETDKSSNEIKKNLEKAIPKDINNVIKSWKSFTSEFDSPIKNMLYMCLPGYLEGDILCIVTKDKVSETLLNNKSKVIEEKLLDKFEKKFNLLIICEKEYTLKHKKLFGTEDKSMEILKSYGKIEEKIDISINFI